MERPPELNPSEETQKRGNGFDVSLGSQLSPQEIQILKEKVNGGEEKRARQGGENRKNRDRKKTPVVEVGAPKTLPKKEQNGSQGSRQKEVRGTQKNGAEVIAAFDIRLEKEGGLEESIKKETKSLLPSLEKLPSFSCEKIGALIKKIKEGKELRERHVAQIEKKGMSFDSLRIRQVQIPACDRALSELEKLRAKLKEKVSSSPKHASQKNTPSGFSLKKESLVQKPNKEESGEETLKKLEKSLPDVFAGIDNNPLGELSEGETPILVPRDLTKTETRQQNVIETPEGVIPSPKDVEEFFGGEEVYHSPDLKPEESQNKHIREEEEEAIEGEKQRAKESLQYDLPLADTIGLGTKVFEPTQEKLSLSGTLEQGIVSSPDVQSHHEHVLRNEQEAQESGEAWQSGISPVAEHREHGPSFISPEHERVVRRIEELRIARDEEQVAYGEHTPLRKFFSWPFRKLKNKGVERELKEVEQEQSRIERREAEQELDHMPREERLSLWYGVKNAGFFWKELKSNGMAKLCSLGEGESGFGKFFHALADTYRDDALEARRQIEVSDTTRFSTLKSSGVLAGDMVVLGRSAAELFRLTTGYTLGLPFRYGMVTAQLFSRGALAAKEARLESEAVQEKTRIEDIGEAWEEAIRIYKAAEKKHGGVPTKAELETSYQEQLPTDLINRLAQQKEFVFSNLAQGFAQKILFSRIERAKEHGKLDEPAMQRFLRDCDRMIGRSGAVDMWAFGAKTAEIAGKAAMVAIGIESVVLAIKHFLPDFMDVMGKHVESWPLTNTPSSDISSQEIPQESPSAMPPLSQVPAESMESGPSRTPSLKNPEIFDSVPELSPAAARVVVDGVAFELPQGALSIGEHGPEGAIIQHLVSHHPQEISREKAGWLAHRMFDRFMGTDDAKEFMATHGINNKEELMKFMTRIKEGSVELDAQGDMHLKDISFVKGAARKALEQISPEPVVPKEVLLVPQGEAAAILEQELPTLDDIKEQVQSGIGVTLPQDIEASNVAQQENLILLKERGVPREVLDALSKNDIMSLAPENAEIYSDRVQELLFLGVPAEDVVHFPPQELIDGHNEHTDTILANLRKPFLRASGIPDSVVENMAHHDIRSLHAELVPDVAANALVDFETPEGRVVIQGGRVYAQNYHRGFLDVSKYLNPDYRETLKGSGIKNIYFAETKIKDEARFLALYEKALKAYEGKPQARVIKKAMEQLIGTMEKQYGDVFKDDWGQLHPGIEKGRVIAAAGEAVRETPTEETMKTILGASKLQYDDVEGSFSGRFRYNAEGTIVGFEDEGRTNVGGTLALRKLVLHEKWRELILDNPRIMNKGSAIREIENMAENIGRRSRLLQTLQGIGKQNTTEYSFLEKMIKGDVVRIEKRYGDVFKN